MRNSSHEKKSRLSSVTNLRFGSSSGNLQLSPVASASSASTPAAQASSDSSSGAQRHPNLYPDLAASAFPSQAAGTGISPVSASAHPSAAPTVNLDADDLIRHCKSLSRRLVGGER